MRPSEYGERQWARARRPGLGLTVVFSPYSACLGLCPHRPAGRAQGCKVAAVSLLQRHVDGASASALCP